MCIRDRGDGGLHVGDVPPKNGCGASVGSFGLAGAWLGPGDLLGCGRSATFATAATAATSTLRLCTYEEERDE